MSNDRLKFRAWDNFDGEMLGPFHLFDVESDETGQLFLGGAKAMPFHLEVMQWTGLYDGEGAEVFEGDIVKSGMTGASYVVCWSDENSAWYKQMLGANVADRPIYQDDLTWVVGNCYEHPELMEHPNG